MLSQEMKNMISSPIGVRDVDFRTDTMETLEKTRQCASHLTIHRERYRQGLKSFHVITKPLKTAMLVENQKWLSSFVADSIEDDFIHIAPSNELVKF